MKATRGTADWAYRCNPAGATPAATRELLANHNFLWRSLHSATGRKVPSVQLIEVGDTIHVYFTTDGADAYVGSYLVEQPTDRAELADRGVPALQAVSDGPLFEALQAAGYEKDPELGCFTGFRVKQDLYPRPLGRTPKWVARNAIVRVKRDVP